MAFELPDLPYAYDALAAGGMSKETLEFHHDLHHKAYVDNGNKLLEGSGHEGKSLEEIVAATYQAGALVQSGLFNNASQHWNHIQFWEMMGPQGRAMPSELEKALGFSLFDVGFQVGFYNGSCHRPVFGDDPVAMFLSIRYG